MKSSSFPRARIPSATAIAFLPLCLASNLLGAADNRMTLGGDPTFGETVDVHLVTIEVSVKPMLGERSLMDLSREDFTVLEDGLARPITHFERIRNGRIEPTPTAARQPTQLSAAATDSVPLSTVLAFDFGSIGQIQLDRAVRQANRYVDELGASQRWSVVVIGSAPRVVLPFTDDVQRVSAALQSVSDMRRGDAVTGWATGPFLSGRPRLPPVGGSPNLPPGGLALPTVDRLIVQGDRLSGKVQARALFRSLGELFRGWSSLEGSKNLVMFYQPYPTSLDFDRSSALESHELHTELEAVARWAGVAGFTVHAADAGGLGNPSFGGSSLLASHSVGHSLAIETGGRHLTLNDLGRSIELATDQAQNHYRISFQVDRVADGEEHEIEVLVQRPGIVRVRHPESYLDLNPRDRLLQQLETSANIPKTADRLPLSLAVHVDPSEEESMPMRAVVSIPSEKLGLLWGEDGNHAQVEFFLAVYGADGHLLSVDSELRSVGDTTNPSVLTQAFSARLPTGSYTIAMAALDTVDGNVGMDYTRIHP